MPTLPSGVFNVASYGALGVVQSIQLLCLWGTELEDAVEFLRNSEGHGGGVGRAAIGPACGGTGGDHFPARRGEPGNKVSRVFDLISAASRGAPCQADSVLNGQSLQLECHKGQRDKAGPLQTALDHLILHEKPPDPLGAIVLDHNHNGALIKSQLISIPPLGAQVKRVAEALGCPNVPPVVAVKIAQGRQREFGGEGHGTASDGRSNRAIIILGRWGTACGVARRSITGGQSPNVAAIS